ncbi:MAG: phosphomannomutase, partial [Candidatus Competibacteraceae bacterium]|nr:phosphomannomutase [Candidatus Competibacteraceae bacterium]
MTLTCFKAYDIRGRVPDQLNEEVAYRIGRAYVQHLQARRVVVGRDIRLTSTSLAQALSRGLTDGGADVLDIGLCGTEEVYFATFHHGLDGGIMVTASHNPMDYNGMKLVREGARPISGDSGLEAIRELAEGGRFAPAARQGRITRREDKEAFTRHLLSYINPTALRPLKLVVNPGNGGAGLVIDRLAPRLPFRLERLHFEPDGRFPNGIPNPLLPDNRAATREAVLATGADMGLAWDGDFDRCFFFDQQGRFIEGYYLVGLLAESLLARHPGERIIHDPRLTWNTIESVRAAGGIAVQSKTGHAFIKERMRQENALYGGEMSAHHYFRDFAYCDSGMIPWLLVAELVSRRGPLSQLVEARMAAFPCSGELNFRVADPQATIEAILAAYAPDNP